MSTSFIQIYMSTYILFQFEEWLVQKHNPETWFNNCALPCLAVRTLDAWLDDSLDWPGFGIPPLRQFCFSLPVCLSVRPSIPQIGFEKKRRKNRTNKVVWRKSEIKVIKLNGRFENVNMFDLESEILSQSHMFICRGMCVDSFDAIYFTRILRSTLQCSLVSFFVFGFFFGSRLSFVHKQTKKKHFCLTALLQ